MDTQPPTILATTHDNQQRLDPSGLLGDWQRRMDEAWGRWENASKIWGDLHPETMRQKAEYLAVARGHETEPSPND